MIDAANKDNSRFVNVGAQRVAAVYAKGFLGATEKAGTTDALVAELESVCDLLAENPELEALLGSGLISHEEKAGVLDRIFQDRVAPLVLDFLKVLSQHGRLDVTRAVGQEVQKLYDELRGRVRVEMRTATPIDEALARNVEASLRTLLTGEPQVYAAVDPALIGGILLRVGDTVYDGSVARQLRQAREQMINRSIHEIQSRRDRFRHSGGN
jgi:F-type H+-transporting ATPase subunit delta